MSTRTVNWDCRQQSKWRHSSSGSLPRDSHSTPLENQLFGVKNLPSLSADQKRADFHANIERDTLVNPTPASARLSVTRVDTHSHNGHRFPLPSVSHVAPDSGAPKRPTFTASSKSSHLAHKASVNISRTHDFQPASSRKHSLPSLHALTSHSEVIDLTMQDTEDELAVEDVLVPDDTPFGNKNADPGSSRRLSSSRRSSPVAPEHSLFTPPPRTRRPRLFINYVEAPTFPNGLTKNDYLPLFSQPGPILTGKPPESSYTPTTPQQKVKERESVIVSPREQLAPTGMVSDAFLDAFYHTLIPLYDDDTYPRLTTLDLATNSRFHFAYAWRGHASRLREAELDWITRFKFGRPCILAQSIDATSPRISGIADYVSIGQLRSWEVVLPSQETSDEQIYVAGGEPGVEVGTSHSPLLDDALPVTSPSSPAASSSMLLPAVDAESDMNQFLDGPDHSPRKSDPLHRHLVPAHTFHPPHPQSVGRASVDPLELGFGFDPRLVDAGGECFLGLPPSPTMMNSPVTSGPTSDSFDSLTGFAAEAPFAHVWSFGQGEDLPDNSTTSGDGVLPIAANTIDPSLLGPANPQQPPPVSTVSASKTITSKRRSDLPKPVIYMRRPMDSSTPPLVSGKRPVQIKYRDPEDSTTSPSTPWGSKEPSSSNHVEDSPALSTDEADGSPRQKRRSVPSRKLQEHRAVASESDSDFIPEASTSNLRLKIRVKRSNAKEKEPAANASPILTCCHQCRNTTARPKMFCSNVNGSHVCGKRFCNRCILNRYPEITFDENSASFLCPVCTNTCNCSICSRNRGEEFISMRLGGLAASLFKTKVTFVRDADEQQPPPLERSVSGLTTPTPEPSAIPAQPQFWAHVYGLEGERMGKAFMTRQHMERLGTRRASPPPPRPRPTRREKKRERPKGPRVFIGSPLPSWHVGMVRDLEPSVDVGNTEQPLSTAGSRRRRVYIGSARPLHEPYGRMPGVTDIPTPPLSRYTTPPLRSDGSLTPPSEPEVDYWPQPEVGECCSWAPPMLQSQGQGSGNGITTEVDSSAADAGMETAGVNLDVGGDANMDVNMDVDAQALSEQDLARAIGAALAALSVNPSL